MPLPSRLIWTLLLAIFSTNVYRAATQSITIDEVYTYQLFVAPAWSQALTTWNANHHVLNSLLTKLTTGVFGTSELAMRLPSLLGGLIYLLAARAIVLRAFSGLWAVAAFALLSLNPFVLDYLSVARGYGLALGFLVAALWFFLDSEWRWAGLCLGLSVSSNLSFLFPAAALGGMAAVMEIRRGHLWRFLEATFVPAVVIAFIVNIGPLSRAKPDMFYWGVKNLRETLKILIDATFRRVPPRLEVVIRIAEALVVCVLVATAVALIAILRKRVFTATERLILLNGGAVWLCLAFSWLAHTAFGLLYPLERTGLYWPVMLTLAALALVQRYARWRWSQWLAISLVIVCVIQFLREFTVSYYAQWRYDAGGKRIATQIGKKAGTGKIKIACSGPLSFSLEYYRMRNRAAWEILPEPETAAGLHVLQPQDVRPDMNVVYRDSISDAVIAISP